ncbi:MAG: 3'-phosphoadenosine 5'-phosphosulfate sulfotransferase [Thermoplasmata archaeon HGW-Thermoplasmata-1]|nr:MAG: 3'-phosphoadenosine 5'-phosphosulfate sulfotransferase [Thermoplasmata archaeon HGW-Thermoplasmata-1]
MAAVRLGKMVLNWCDSCNLPIVDSRHCGACGGDTKPVSVTPPGDIRPAFPFDIAMIREKADIQFGEGTGAYLIPGNRVVILNKCPSDDRMDEIVMDGSVIGVMRFELSKIGFVFQPRLEGAARIAASGAMKKNFVVADEGAIRPIIDGANLLSPGVVDCAEGVGAGAEVIVLDGSGRVVAVGKTRVSGSDMMTVKRGVAVKTRWSCEPIDAGRYAKCDDRRPGTWDDAVAANLPKLEMIRKESAEFIRNTVERHADLPLAVSFSGGKDSLATLLLVLDAGYRPKMLYVDTGLEFPESIENVHRTAERLGLDLVEERVGDRFWKCVEYFGPPGRDFRWCCKISKLGPMTRLITEKFPEGVLSFIGQRRYESEQRASKGNIWRNPWVPRQLGASPIQEWTALHVWLYLFWRTPHYGVDWNPWYEKGLERIGCWLCPACDVAEMELAMKAHGDYDKFASMLLAYASMHGFTDDWLRYGYWRWRKAPQAMVNWADEAGIVLRSKGTLEKASSGVLAFESSGGAEISDNGFCIRGGFNRKIDLARAANILCTIGEVKKLPDGGIIAGDFARISASGEVSIYGRDEKEIRSRTRNLTETVARALDCVGCGICIGRCELGAIRLKDHRIVVDESKCIHCGACLGKCPIVDFGSEHDFDMGA